MELFTSSVASPQINVLVVISKTQSERWGPMPPPPPHVPPARCSIQSRRVSSLALMPMNATVGVLPTVQEVGYAFRANNKVVAFLTTFGSSYKIILLRLNELPQGKHVRRLPSQRSVFDMSNAMRLLHGLGDCKGSRHSCSSSTCRKRPTVSTQSIVGCSGACSPALEC